MEMQPTQRPNRIPALLASLELAGRSWKAALTDGRRDHPTVIKVDQAILWHRLEQFVERLQEVARKWGLPPGYRVTVLYEAGQDGFWIARALEAKGIQVLVVDAASIP